jgi:hypothetical protein
MFKFEVNEVVKYIKTDEELVVVNRFKDRMNNTYFCKDRNNKIDAYSENDLKSRD